MCTIKNAFLAIVMVLITTAAWSQTRIDWMTWEEAMASCEKQKKKILVDVYTDWCGWCKKMDKLTFQQKEIAEYVNENYYAVKFDAEQKEELQYKGKTYKYVGGFGRRGYHELAAEIMSGRLSYPTVVFIDENLSVIQPIAGFQDAKTFEMIMIYFAENHYKTVPWQKFVKLFDSKGFNPRNNVGVQPVKNN